MAVEQISIFDDLEDDDNPGQKLVKPVIDYYEDFEKLEPKVQLLFTDVEIDILKDRSKMRREAEESLLNFMRQEHEQIVAIRECDKQIIKLTDDLDKAVTRDEVALIKEKVNLWKDRKRSLECELREWQNAHKSEE